MLTTAKVICAVFGVLGSAHPDCGGHDMPLTTVDIRDFMAQHYGQHDAKSKSWVRREDVDKDGFVLWNHSICASAAVTMKGEPRLMLAVCNDSNVSHSEAEFDKNETNIDLYELTRHDGKVTVLASGSGLRDVFYGMPSKAAVVRLGQDIYGFDMQGDGMATEMGCGYTAREVLMPDAPTRSFTTVLELTNWWSNGGPNEDQPQTTGSVDVLFDQSRPGADFYPVILKVSISTEALDEDGQGTHTVGKDLHRQYVVKFDRKLQQYVLPASFPTMGDSLC